jgi:hypothetical protein
MLYNSATAKGRQIFRGIFLLLRNGIFNDNIVMQKIMKNLTANSNKLCYDFSRIYFTKKGKWEKNEYFR